MVIFILKTTAKIMEICENYNRAKQIYGESLAQEALKCGIPNQYVYSVCKFHTENNTPFSILLSLFKQWMTYVRDNSKIDINQLDYASFIRIIENGKQGTFSVGEIYNDGIVSIRKITDFDQLKKLPFDNYWCIRKPKWWKEYKEKEPPAEFLLVTNKNYSFQSHCQYVMVEMYSNGDIGYWSTDNELIDELGVSRRLPKLDDYKTTLGDALTIIEQERNKLMNNAKTESRARLTNILTEEVFRRFKRKFLQL